MFAMKLHLYIIYKARREQTAEKASTRENRVTSDDARRWAVQCAVWVTGPICYGIHVFAGGALEHRAQNIII